MIYLVTYELDDDGADDGDLVAAMRSYDAVHVHGGTWLVEADEAAKDVRARLGRATRKRRCRLFAGRLQGDYAYLNLSVEAADWLDDRDECDFD